MEQDVYQAPGERAGPFLLTVKPRSFNYLYISFYDPVPFRRSLIYIYNNKRGNENQDQQLIQIWKPKWISLIQINNIHISYGGELSIRYVFGYDPLLLQFIM